mmetsp:Transcript_18797/g.29343  ORF Transcript_18797/g.29343 Transcript_18797/m.29343 type:complete len:171 (-) Transcript_18797:439-951(-)
MVGTLYRNSIPKIKAGTPNGMITVKAAAHQNVKSFVPGLGHSNVRSALSQNPSAPTSLQLKDFSTANDPAGYVTNKNRNNELKKRSTASEHFGEAMSRPATTGRININIPVTGNKEFIMSLAVKFVLDVMHARPGNPKKSNENNADVMASKLKSCGGQSTANVVTKDPPT